MINIDPFIDNLNDKLESQTYYCAIIHGKTFSTWTNNGLKVFYARKGDLISAIARRLWFTMGMAQRANISRKELSKELKARFGDENNKDFRIRAVKL